MPVNFQHGKLVAYLAVFIGSALLSDAHAQADDIYYDSYRGVWVYEYDFSDEPITITPDYDDSDFEAGYGEYDDSDMEFNTDYDDGDMEFDFDSE